MFSELSKEASYAKLPLDYIVSELYEHLFWKVLQHINSPPPPPPNIRCQG